MRTLAIETSCAAGSVAALEDDQVVSQITLDPAQRTARSLAPGLREVLRSAGWRPRDVQLVAVCVGPGSFTGLRLGVTTAKTFAYAAGAEVLGVNTLEVIAAQAPAACSPLEVVMDAQRGDVFAGSFVRDEQGALLWTETTRLLDADAWLRAIPPAKWVSGPALVRMAERSPEQIKRVEAPHWQPTAAAVGRLACCHYQSGRRENIFQLVPLYVRPSAAEEKAAASNPRPT